MVGRIGHASERFEECLPLDEYIESQLRQQVLSDNNTK